MKKVLAIVLCLLMIVAVLGGCTKTPATSSDSGTASTGDDSSDTLTAAEQAIADRKASGTNTKMVYSFYTWTGRPAGTEWRWKSPAAHDNTCCCRLPSAGGLLPAH